MNCGVKIEEVQVEMHERIAGTSYLDFKNSIWYMMKMFFSIFIFNGCVNERKETKNERHAEKVYLLLPLF